jgi:hypothetical protein
MVRSLARSEWSPLEYRMVRSPGATERLSKRLGVRLGWSVSERCPDAREAPLRVPLRLSGGSVAKPLQAPILSQ